MATLGALRATLYRVDPAAPPFTTVAAVDGPHDIDRFLEDLAADAARSQPEAILLEQGPELDPEPSCTREDLLAFRFGSNAGVALDALRAAWLRWYLRALHSRLDERPMGELTLFTGSVLAGLARPGGPAWDDPLAGDVQVLWLPGYDDEAERRWVAAAPRSPTRSAAHVGGADEATMLAALRRELGALGLHPVPLPVPAPLYVLPLLAHPIQAARERGRFEEAVSLARRFTAHNPDDLDPAALQELDVLWLRCAAFADSAALRRVLVRLVPPDLAVLASDGALAAAVARAFDAG